MVSAFAVSRVVRGYHEYEDVWNAPMMEHKFLVKEKWVIQKIQAAAVIERSPGGRLTLGHTCFPTTFSYLLGTHLSQLIFNLPVVL